MVNRIASLLDRARRENVPIFHVRHEGGPGHILERETAGWDLHHLVTPQEREPVVDKQHSSCFQDTALHQHLQALQIDRLVIAGMQTEYCVDSACRAATALGYRSILVADAHTTFDTSVLSAAQIIAHHNLTLGDSFAELALGKEVRF